MKFNQVCNGVDIIDIAPKEHNPLQIFLSDTFKRMQWDAFNHKFFISDNDKGRHETMDILRKYKQTLKP